jgi:MscS family membrane protein
MDWKEKIDHILYLPFQILLWILGAALALEVLGKRFGFSFFDEYIDGFRSSAFVLCVAWVLIRGKGVAEKTFLNKDQHIRRIDPGFVNVVGKLISIVVIAISLMIILQIWGLNIAPLIAFGGIGAAAIGFAAKDVLANFFGGLMIHINRPFMVGDFIHLPDHRVEGHIEDIGWNVTTVRDKEKRPAYLPNSIFSGHLVVNAARMTHRRIEERIGIRYEDFEKVPDLVENIKLAISQHPDIDTHLPVLVVLNSFGQYSLELYIDVYTLQTRYEKYLRAKHEVLLLVYDEIKKLGAEMPAPIVSLAGKVLTGNF